MFTNDVEAFTDCWSIIVAPISDHKMVTFNITDTSGEHSNSKTISLQKFQNITSTMETMPKWGLHLKKQTEIKS